MTVFFRLLELSADKKPEALFRAVDELRRRGTCQQSSQTVLFEREPEMFAAVPGSPFAYWASDRVLATFRRIPRFTKSGVATVGLQSSDDFRFLRLWWESFEKSEYSAFAKGGSESRYYADPYLQVAWGKTGKSIKAFAERTPGSSHWSRNIRSAEHYFRPGLTWPRRTNGLSFRVMPSGCIFADKGPAAFVEGDSTERLLALNAILNSLPFGYLVSLQLARTELAQSYEVGLIQQTPVPDLAESEIRDLAQRARRAWSLKRSLDTVNEISHAFVLPSGLNERITGLDRAAIETELALIQRQIDDRAFELYGVGSEDRAVIESSSRTAAKSEDEAAETSDDEEDADKDIGTLDAGEQAAVTSWLVGVAFGRFDPRLATGERAVPLEPEPFDRLPIRSPGMWPEGEEPQDAPDILVDDEGHGADLTARVTEIAERVHSQAPESLRAWLAREFFPLHIRMYSKSRRKAPIYWQLATLSGSYSVWLYLHALTKDSLFRVQHEYVGPKLLHEERRLESLRREFGENPSRAERKQITEQESFVSELRAFLEEVERVAPLWKPDLDDGVVINFAPLWRLVGHCTSWQKELKSTWDALCEGKYDWAHLAMHLWPERVVPKCARDRSLAIAHGLEKVFWAENSEEKWVARETPTRSIAELVRERTSLAVNAALEHLRQAPQNGGRPRARRARATGDV